MPKTQSFFLVLLYGMFLSGCVTFAPPAPMLTYGGPEITPKGASETAIGFGTGAALFSSGHAGAQGWFGRYKYGIHEKFDLGVDMLGVKRNSGLAFTFKGAVRYQLHKNIRLEFGLGAADDSNGKSLNGDFAATFGTRRDKPWNYYSSLRFGYANGFPGNVIFSTSNSSDTIAPPNTLFGVLNVGTQGNIGENQKFIFEGGYGYIFPKEQSAAPVFYVSAGLFFYIGGKKRQ